MEHTLSNTNITEKELIEEFKNKIKNKIEFDMEYLLTTLNTYLSLVLENKCEKLLNKGDNLIYDIRYQILNLIAKHFLESNAEENNPPNLNEFYKIITNLFKNTHKIENKVIAANIIIYLSNFYDRGNFFFGKDRNIQNKITIPKEGEINYFKYLKTVEDVIENILKEYMDKKLYQHIDIKELYYDTDIHSFLKLSTVMYEYNQEVVAALLKKSNRQMELYEYYLKLVKNKRVNPNLMYAFKEGFKTDEIRITSLISFKCENIFKEIIDMHYEGVKPKIIIENKPVDYSVYFDLVLFKRAGIIENVDFRKITRNLISLQLKSYEVFIGKIFFISKFGYLSKNEETITEFDLMRDKILKDTEFDHEDILGKNLAFYTTILDTFFENIKNEQKKDFIKSINKKEYIALYEECKLKIQLQNF